MISIYTRIRLKNLGRGVCVSIDEADRSFIPQVAEIIGSYVPNIHADASEWQRLYDTMLDDSISYRRHEMVEIARSFRIDPEKREEPHRHKPVDAAVESDTGIDFTVTDYSERELLPPPYYFVMRYLPRKNITQISLSINSRVPSDVVDAIITATTQAAQSLKIKYTILPTVTENEEGDEYAD